MTGGTCHGCRKYSRNVLELSQWHGHEGLYCILCIQGRAVEVGEQVSSSVGDSKGRKAEPQIPQQYPAPQLSLPDSFVPKVVWLNGHGGPISFKSFTAPQVELLVRGEWYWDLYQTVNDIDYWRRAVYIHKGKRRRRITKYHGRRD